MSFGTLLLSFAFVLLAYRIASHLIRRRYVASFDRKRVLVTGTDSGFGRQLALRLDAMGLVMYCCCYTEEGAASLTAEASSRARVLRLDISDAASVARARDVVVRDLSETGSEGAAAELWGLVNNAGVVGPFVFEWSRADDFRRVMEVNFLGAVRVTDAFLPLVRRARGRVVNVASMAGRLAFCIGPYDCSKFALEAYSDILRRMTSPHGVKVSTIEPGAYMGTGLVTPDILSTSMQSSWEKLPPEVRAELGGETHRRQMKSSLERAINLLPRVGNDDVIDSMCHALGSRHPKARYVCGVDARVATVAATCCPDWLIDYVMIALFRYIGYVR